MNSKPRYVVFDVETTGLLPYKEIPTSSNIQSYPHIMQICWMVYDDEYNLLKERNCLIKPEGYRTVSEKAVAVHGITYDYAKQNGVELTPILREFNEDANSESVSLVGHNIVQYDIFIIAAEMMRRGIDYGWLDGKDVFDTMQIALMLKVCNKIFEEQGYRPDKYPKLTELYKALFGTEFEGAHDAMADVKACWKCFIRLKEINEHSSDYPKEGISNTKSTNSLGLIVVVIVIIIILFVVLKFMI